MLLPIFELEMKEKYFFPTIKPKNREIFWKYKETKEKYNFSIFEMKGKGHEPS